MSLARKPCIMMVLLVMIMRKNVDISVAQNPSITNILYQTQSEFNHDLQTKHVVDNQQIRRACTVWPSGRERDWGGGWRGGEDAKYYIYCYVKKRRTTKACYVNFNSAAYGLVCCV